jgi:uncharacterized protein with FMN-binding domain
VRRITVALLGTISSIVLLLAYPTSHNASASGGEGTTTGSAGEAAAAGSTPTPSSSKASGSKASGSKASGSKASGSKASGAAKTYTGQPADTRWGTVQVQITVQGGKVTGARAVQYPNDNGHDQEVNAYALPILAQEAVAAQSASIDAVSGATVTSGGYVQSLQSALDAAHL